MPGERRITKKRVNLSLFLFITLLVLICDQISKLLIQNLISLGDSIPIVKNIFHLTLVYNRGAAFGIFKTQTTLFIIIGAITIFLMIFYLPRLKRESLFVRIGFALISGGILGNLIDRLKFGYVIDFLDFRVWPVFNIADSAITIGAALLVIQLLRRKTRHAPNSV